jgi:hypothetical protein
LTKSPQAPLRRDVAHGGACGYYWQLGLLLQGFTAAPQQWLGVHGRKACHQHHGRTLQHLTCCCVFAGPQAKAITGRCDERGGVGGVRKASRRKEPRWNVQGCSAAGYAGGVSTDNQDNQGNQDNAAAPTPGHKQRTGSWTDKCPHTAREGGGEGKCSSGM